MANSAQARKRARQAEKRRQHNAGFRSMMRTYIKRVRAAITSGEKTQADEALKEAVSIIDRMTSKALIHKNKAARLKKRLNTQVKNMLVEG